MIKHIVMWKFKPGTEEQMNLFLTKLRALQGVIPQLLKSEVAVNVLPGNYDADVVDEIIGVTDADALAAAIASRNRRLMAGYGS